MLVSVGGVAAVITPLGSLADKDSSAPLMWASSLTGGSGGGVRDGSGASTLKFTSLSPLEDDDDLRTGSMEGITESELLLPSRSAAMAVGCGADARSAAGVTAGATSTPVGPLSSGSSENNNDDDDDEEGGAGFH